jgi:hypothetical protein
MCADPFECDGLTDHCCKKTLEECDSPGYYGPRQCSALLDPALLEWRGIREAGIVLPGDAITTRPPSEQVTTSVLKGFDEYVEENLPVILFSTGGCGLFVVFCVACFLLRENFSNISKSYVGATRIARLIKGDNVGRIGDSGKPVPSAWRTAPLDPLPDEKAIAKRAADVLATTELDQAVRSAYNLGKQHIVTSSKQPDPPEKLALIVKLAAFKARGLDRRASYEIQNMIEMGETWLSIVDAERKLVRFIETGKSDLKRRVEEEDFRIEYQWDRIEELAQAIKRGKLEKASPSLVHDANEIFTHLVARCRELPADRVVLDPAGEGVRILPIGNQRAIWPTTGECYTYGTGSDQFQRNNPGAAWVGTMSQLPGSTESLPCAPEELGNCAVDPCRPVCSIYVKKGKCHYGRRCPWRHCKPLPGDSIKEPIGVDEA